MTDRLLVGDEIELDAVNALIRLPDYPTGAVHLRLGSVDICVEPDALRPQTKQPIGFAAPVRKA
jgi:hypothetical protein